ncbi:MAG: hypothetical protein AABM64_18575 [Pseudomonadota bacterium]
MVVSVGGPRLAFLAMIAVLTSGCATQASLTVMSQPEGAFITEKGSGTSYGTAPVTVFYDGATLLRHKNADGCYLVKGFEARWVSGTTASLDFVRLCASNVGDYNISFSRDPAQPSLDKDLQFALQLQALRAQQQQAKAAQDAASAALFSAWANTQRPNVNCTSTQIGNTVQTNCR